MPDESLSTVRDNVDLLGLHLATWAARSEPDAHARTAAAEAMQAIDRSIFALHRIRETLAGEIRARDDAAIARADALLAETRNHGPE